MKKLLALCLTLCSFNLLAASFDEYNSYVCKTKTGGMVVVIEQQSKFFDHSSKTWDWWAKYQVAITSRNNQLNTDGFSSLGNARGEDVYFEFGARKRWHGKKVKLNIWLDEMETSASLYIDENRYKMSCVTFADL